MKKQPLEIRLQRPHQAQHRIIKQLARFNVLNCGRRWGKTTFGVNRVATPQTLHSPVGWFSPSYKEMLEVWRECVQLLHPIIARSNASERVLEFVTGGVLEFWSLHNNQDAARGRKYQRVIIDEAAMSPNLLNTWNAAIRPTLADLEGDAFILSTPKGMNDFWQMYQWGMDPERDEWRAWTNPTRDNPFISVTEIESMRAAMPDRVFRQEILAEFITDAGSVFRRVMAAATAIEQERAVRGHQYIFGVDWAKYSDFTVITVLDANTSEMVYMDRFNQIDYAVQRGRLAALYERFFPKTIVVEKNSMGDPIIEQLQRDGLPVRPFTVTSVSKTQIIDELALAFERGTIRIINDPVLVTELQSFETQRSPSGMLRYTAPAGIHDDTVMALAMAWSALSTNPPSFNSLVGLGKVDGYQNKWKI